MIRTIGSSALILALATTVAAAQQTQPMTPAPQAVPPVTQTMPRANMPAAQVLTSLPGEAATITHWYKQAIYDPNDSRIGEIDDVLVDREGKIVALVVGVGGFLGIGEKHVAVPQSSVRATTKDSNKWYLVMNTTKDALKNAPGYRYDRSGMVWMPESAPATTGAARPPAR